MKYIVPGVALFAALYFVWTWIKSRSPYNFVSGQDNERVAQVSSTTMANGRTYFAFADELFNSMYWNWWIISEFGLCNTDEKSLGMLLQTVKRDEYAMLSDVYLMIKKQKSSNNRPLTEDLMRTFNKSEQRMYLSHLMDIV